MIVIEDNSTKKRRRQTQLSFAGLAGLELSNTKCFARSTLSKVFDDSKHLRDGKVNDRYDSKNIKSPCKGDTDFVSELPIGTEMTPIITIKSCKIEKLDRNLESESSVYPEKVSQFNCSNKDRIGDVTEFNDDNENIQLDYFEIDEAELPLVAPTISQNSMLIFEKRCEIVNDTVIVEKCDTLTINRNDNEINCSIEVQQHKVESLVHIEDTSDVIDDIPDNLEDTEIVILDFETTGFFPKRNRVIEVGAICIRGDKVIKTYQSLCNPNQKVPKKVTNLTGITSDMLIGQPETGQVIKELYEFIGNRPILAHNSSFGKLYYL